MAKSKKATAVQRIVIVGSILIALQGIYLYVFSSQEPVTEREAISTQLDKIKGPSQEKERKRILAAIMDFRSKNNGKLPTALSELMPTYFDRIPIDSNTGKPFKYTVENNNPIVGERTLLASAGVNGQTSQSAQESLIASLTEDSEKAAFVYDPTGKRDPFRPFNFAPKLTDGSKTPLEKYSIGQLKLTAVLGQGDEASAMVENALGKGFPVRKGTKIGTNGGEVVEILPDKVLILETMTDFTGQTKSRTIELRLRTKDQNIDEIPPSANN